MSRKKYVPLQKRLAEDATKVEDHSEQSIQVLLYEWADKKSGVKYTLSSVYIYNFDKFRWETDFFICTNSFHSHEYEIKIHRSDFRRDKQKVKKHDFISSVYNKEDITIDYFIPNRFSYVCPQGVIPIDEVPEYAGLIEILDLGKIKIVKKAPLIIDKPSMKLTAHMADRFYKKSRRDEMNYIAFIESFRNIQSSKISGNEKNIALEEMIKKYRKNKRI